MRPSTDRIDIAASAQRIAVDHRISLRFYHRIADNILKQGEIFRREKNIIDLYVMLLRFSSLATETIPFHRDYRSSLQSDKNCLKKKLLNAVSELEALKPAVQQRVNELNRKHAQQVNGSWYHRQNDSSIEQADLKRQNLTGYNGIKLAMPAGRDVAYQSSYAQQTLHSGPVDQRFGRMSLNLIRPTEETLSRHSILGPNGLLGQWQPPRNDTRVSYPSNIELSPIEIPSLVHPIKNGFSTINENSNSEPCSQQDGDSSTSGNGDSSTSGNQGHSQLDHGKSLMSSLSVVNNPSQMQRLEEPPMINLDTLENPVCTSLIRQPSPPPVLAELQDLIPAMASDAVEVEHKIENSLPDEIARAEAPLQLHISTTMMENFMKLAKSNTDRNLETCGILAGSLKNRKFYITALIIPKQESTSDSCQATNEEEIFEVQDKQSLFPLGWIHTHPTQSCFMSSIDVHTHYSYQIMLPESVAIVMAPRDSSRKHGIFRLTTPGGMSIIRNCSQRGFHPHDQPPDGGPIYKSCTDVYMNPNLKFDVIDLR